MRKTVTAIVGVTCLGWVLLAHPTRGPATAPPESAAPQAGTDGRYEVAVIGSRGPQRFGTAFRLDTKTGKGWRVIVRLDLVEKWIEIGETEGKGPTPGGEAGRFQLAADLISDRLGQETAIAARIDTRTGKGWFLRPLSDPPTWIPLEEAGEGTGADR